MPQCNQESVDFIKLPQLATGDVVMTAIWDYYDGPVSGTAEYQGSTVWFQMYRPSFTGTDLYLLHPRHYLVYALAESALTFFYTIINQLALLREARNQLAPDDPGQDDLVDEWEQAWSLWEAYPLENYEPLGWFTEEMA